MSEEPPAPAATAPAPRPSAPDGLTPERLAQRIARLESWVADHSTVTAVIDEHEDRLDAHDRQLESVTRSLGEIRAALHGLGSNVAGLDTNVGRLADELTSRGLGVEGLHAQLKKDRGEQLQHNERTLGMLQRLVDYLQPKATL